APAHPGFAAIQDHAMELSQKAVADKLNMLRRRRDFLPGRAWRKRTANIVPTLSKLVSGPTNSFHAVRDPQGEIIADPAGIAWVLSLHWQRTFGAQATDGALRERWIGRWRGILLTRLLDLAPTIEDVNAVLADLSASAPGPDGAPFAAFSIARAVIAPLLYDIVHGALRGIASPPDDFDLGFLICLPKGPGSALPGGAECFEAGSARPLSIVDASNRIIASVSRVVLDRAVAPRISTSQRGFARGRRRLRNVLVIDFAAQKISLMSKKGAVLLFDSRAAFPGMDHAFMREVLAAVGPLVEFVNTTKMFDNNSSHNIKAQSQLFDSITNLSGHVVARAFADDTAAAVRGHVTLLPVMAKFFAEFEAISCLAPNIKKTVFTPLWKFVSESNVRALIREAVPALRDMDLCSLKGTIGFKHSFTNIQCVALAAKLRAMEQAAPDCRER
ncbi:unnamed protein product, partial [Prorocentrum cordatum]